MRELSLDHLRTLVAVADLGSLAAAAQALHLAPPTVTVHLAELEARVGAALLVRGRGPVAPTAVGGPFLERARRLLKDADDAVGELRRQLAGQSGRVRLGASTGVIAHMLPPVLEALARERPGVEVQLAVLTSAESMSRLAAGTLDAAVVAMPQRPQRGVQLHRLRRDPVVAVLPAGWQAPARVTARWLADRPLILNDPSTQLSRITLEWFASTGVHCRPAIELNYNDAIRTLVAAGYGAALLPQESDRRSADPRLVERPLSPALWRELGLAFREDAQEGPARHVLQALEKSAAAVTRARRSPAR